MITIYVHDMFWAIYIWMIKSGIFKNDKFS